MTTADAPKVFGDPEGKTELSNMPPVKITCSEVKISRTLYGQAPAKTITVLQYGAGDNGGETKIKKGQKLLMLLKDGGDDGVYASVSWEDGFFEIAKDDRVTSFSDQLATAKYDGTNLELLTRDIAKGLKNIGK